MAIEASDEERAIRAGLYRSMLGVVLLLVFAFSYTEEIVSGAFEASGHAESPVVRIGILVADLVVLALVGRLKRTIDRADGGPRLWGWWWSGLALVVSLDAVLLLTGDSAGVGVDLAASTLYVAAMAILLLSSLNADPRTVVSADRRAATPGDWARTRAVVPLVVGTAAAYYGATLLTDYFDVDVVREPDAQTAAEIAALPLPQREAVLAQLCHNAINSGFFEHVAQVIPLLLLTLGIEFGFFRQSLREPAQRAATTATVTLMSIALVFALSTLPWDGQGCGEVLEAWHEYLTFVITLQAVFTGLATLIWLLVANVADPVEGGRVTDE